MYISGYRCMWVITMFDLPTLRGVEEVVVNGEVVDGHAAPLYVHAKQAKPSEAS